MIAETFPLDQAAAAHARLEKWARSPARSCSRSPEPHQVSAGGCTVEHFGQALAGRAVQVARQRRERVEAGREDLERGAFRLRLAGAAADVEKGVVAAAAEAAAVDAEERGRAGEDEAAFLGRLARRRLAASLVGIDRAARQVQAGEVGMAHEKHPAVVVEREEPHPKAERRPKDFGHAAEGYPGVEMDGAEQARHRFPPVGAPP